MSNRTIPRIVKTRAPGRLDVQINGSAHIPAWIVDHESYRRWARSDEFPETGRFAFLNGTIWVDLTMEQLFAHNVVKTEISRALANVVLARDCGYFFSDGTLLSHPGVGLSTQPDGCFVSYEAVDRGAVKWVEGATQGYIEVEGTPEMTLEVVSPTSVVKDTQELRTLYWQAGVSEYWLVDARAELSFSLLKRTTRGYAETRRQAEGWLKSNVFGAAFRLTPRQDRQGKPRFLLEVR